MDITKIYKKFPGHNDCLRYLEMVRWNNIPKCPYCKSTNSTHLSKEKRHHCNTCNTSFSVTVGTIFHKTKISLQKWFFAIKIVLNTKNEISIRQLAEHLGVNKNTAWYMQMRIRKALFDDRNLIYRISEDDEGYFKSSQF